MNIKNLKDFRTDSASFEKITGKPLILNNYMSALFGRPIVDTLETKKQFNTRQAIDVILSKPALELLTRYTYNGE